MKKKVTMKEIAILSGNSISTVSKVLNKKDAHISIKTREKILNIAKENNYTPNKIASSLVTKKTYSIGLVIPDITNEFFTKMARGAEDYANSKGYNVVLCNTDNNIKKAVTCMNMLEDKMVDGVILASVYFTENINNTNTPIVAIDRAISKLSTCKTIGINNIESAFTIVDYLISTGVKKVLYLTGEEDFFLTKDRVVGYKKALEKNNIPFNKNLIKAGNYTVDWGYKGVMEALKEGLDFDSVFGGNDLVSVGAIKALKEKGLETPKDISVVGFDDIYLSSLITPPLTTISQPMYEIGYEGAKALLNIIENKENSSEQITLNTKLVIRKSTK